MEANAAVLSSSGLPGSIGEMGALLRRGVVSCEQLVHAYLDRIARYNANINALITVTGKEALACAKRLDAELREGRDRGALHGIPIVHKDLLDTAGIRTTVGSAYYEDRIPEQDAYVVRALSAAGAISLGKANLSEFATHPSGRNRRFGDVRNPLDPQRSAGGSSSGTAAAIAADFCLAGTGSDTGGSIRIPASWCGIVGLRPTQGLLSVAGAHPRAGSLDVVGPMARSAGDCALLLHAMQGAPGTIDAARNAPETRTPQDALSDLRVGIIAGYSLIDLDADVWHAVQGACERLIEYGARPVEVHIPQLLDEAFQQRLLRLLLHEFVEILGKHYEACEARTALFSEHVRNDLERGRAVSRDQYLAVLAARDEESGRFSRVFDSVDILLTPTTPSSAPSLLETREETWQQTRRFTLPFSYFGVPSITIPVPVPNGAMPVGIQVIAGRLQEQTLLDVAQGIEAALATDGKHG